MKNPWEEIDLQIYEKHMSLDSVYQLQALNEMMKAQLYTYSIQSAMILGIAGGNGLEHVDSNSFEKVYGVDINASYLEECQKRYPELQDTFEPVCVDLLEDKCDLPHADLVIANLLIEYIGYECFQKNMQKINPQYISCIIQVNTDASFVSDSPYLHAFDGLDEVHHQMEEQELVVAMAQVGYTMKMIEERDLPNGKKLVRIDFAK